MCKETFICQHCQGHFQKNPRLKGDQRYCGSICCQQSRKNKWERERLRSDSGYRAKRALAKRKWYQGYPGDRYQHAYRDHHPDYVKANQEKQRDREKQLKRGKQPSGNESVSKVVKTDPSPAPPSKRLVPRGLYVLIPYKKADGENVVKTDEFVVELRAWSGCQEIQAPGSG